MQIAKFFFKTKLVFSVFYLCMISISIFCVFFSVLVRFLRVLIFYLQGHHPLPYMQDFHWNKWFACGLHNLHHLKTFTLCATSLSSTLFPAVHVQKFCRNCTVYIYCDWDKCAWESQKSNHCNKFITTQIIYGLIDVVLRAVDSRVSRPFHPRVAANTDCVCISSNHTLVRSLRVHALLLLSVWESAVTSVILNLCSYCK